MHSGSNKATTRRKRYPEAKGDMESQSASLRESIKKDVIIGNLILNFWLNQLHHHISDYHKSEGILFFPSFLQAICTEPASHTASAHQGYYWLNIF